ncbi:death-inducer obliterator 1 isoform 2-T2 [Pelodytes ibericus]
MEESTNTQPSETQLENMDCSSPASICDDQSGDDTLRTIKPTSKEFRKTWGFRKTTIAKREGVCDTDMEATESSQQAGPSLRRSGRQPKRTERVEEFLTTVRRNRGRKSTTLEDSSDRSCPVTDAETASEGSVESTPDVKCDSQGTEAQIKLELGGSAIKKDEDDSSDSDGMTLKELQNRLRSRRSDNQASEMVQDQDMTTPKSESHGQTECSVRTRSANQAAQLRHQTSPIKQEAQSPQPAEDLKHKNIVMYPRNRPESEIYDPNILYCICRQPHNNRFMICCDRCEEWFHGDCVGISEARGRLLERNTEDYICPNCTILQVQEESATSSDQKDLLHGESSTFSEPLGTGTTDKSLDDHGIKGRIEKAAHPSGKKKLKIFHPVILESPEVARCIGPGCSNLALQDSVYCSHDCILKHAAATMKSLSVGKEAKPKEKVKVKSEKRSTSISQVAVKPQAVQVTPLPENREATMKKVLVMIPRMSDVPNEQKAESSSTPSWESDHNYIAVKPEKTAAISSTLFYKSDKAEENEKKPETPLPLTTPPVKKEPSILPPTMPMKPISSLPRIPMLKKKTSLAIAPVKQPTKPVADSSKKPVHSKPMSHPSSSAIMKLGPIPRKSAVPSTSALSAPKKAALSSIPSSHKKPTGTSSSNSGTITQSKQVNSSSPHVPNVQIRHNIRRSLKEILWKRVNDSDDLVMLENDVAKIAMNIEKEMFNLFQDTDNRYKSKYRNLMFNLKDPKNQGLFHRVLSEKISLAKLVRLKPEELVSKKMSSWKEGGSKSSLVLKTKSRVESKAHSPRQAVVDMEESPPMSDTDTEQQEPAKVPPPEKSSALLPDIFSSMLSDTTSQHRAHLFDLKCKICTGQMSADDEPPQKRQKTIAATSAALKKPEPKPEISTETPPPPPATFNESDTPMETSDITPPVPEKAPDSTPSQSASPPNPDTPYVSQGPMYPLTNLVTTVTVSGRDPRRAVNRPLIPASTGQDNNPRVVRDAEEPSAETSTSLPSTFTAPKSILMKPIVSSDSRYLASSSENLNMTNTSTPQDGDTSLFLSRLSPIWKGFINMQSVAKFVTKAFPVSGSTEYLNEDLPDTIHIGGRISPKTVWDYVGKLKSSVSKELSLIRFHPATEEEEVAYISLYSYFSSRGRFGVVANNNRHVKDLYLIPLSAKDPIPSKLLPFEGPGLESGRPNLILGLVICQRTKRLATAETEKFEDKRTKGPSQEEIDILHFMKGPVPSQIEKKPQKYSLYSNEIIKSTTPPGSPPPIEPKVTTSVLQLSATKSEGVIPNTSTSVRSASPVSDSSTLVATTSSAKTATPLEHILKTLFGKTSEGKNETSGTTNEEPSAEKAFKGIPLIDPIVQQFGQLSKEKPIDEEDDRPYDPEEEYDPERAFGTSIIAANDKPYEPEQPCENLEDEEAYDPEDETILEEAKVPIEDLPNKMPSTIKVKSLEVSSEYVPMDDSSSLIEQQKMLEELNKQIEEQKKQLEEQEEALRQQRAAVGVSMAHFSVSDALMSPPPKSSITKSELFKQEPAAEMFIPVSSEQVINQTRDPRQLRDPRQVTPKRVQSDKEVSSTQLQNEKQLFLSESIDYTPKDPIVKQSTNKAEEVKPLVNFEQSNQKQNDSVSDHAFKPEDGCWYNKFDISNTSTLKDSSSPPKSSRKVLLPTPGTNAPLQQNFAAGPGESVAISTPWPTESQNFESQQSLSRYPQEHPTKAFEPDLIHNQVPHFTMQTNTMVVQKDNRGAPPFPISSTGEPPQMQFQNEQETLLVFGEPRALQIPNLPGPRPSLRLCEENVPSHLDMQRGPIPERLGEQKGPIPLLSTQFGPFGDRGLPPPQFVGQRGQSPPMFDTQSGPPLEFQDHHFSGISDDPPRFDEQRGPVPPHLMGVRGQPFNFDRPPPSQFKMHRGGPMQPQFGGPRGPAPSHFGGPRGPFPNEFEDMRGPVPGLYAGPRPPPPHQFEEQSESQQPMFNQRAPAPLQFAVQRGPVPSRFSEQPIQILKPQPRPLLELPSIPPPHRNEAWNKGGQSDSHHNFTEHRQGQEQHWEGNEFRQNKDHRNHAFEGRSRERFEGRNEPEAHSSEQAPMRVFEERRRERDGDSQWDRDTGRNWNRERDRNWDRNRDWERQRTKEPIRDWDKNRDGDKEMEKKEWERNRDRDRDKERDRDRDREHKERDRERDRDKDRDRRDRDRDRERDRDRGRDKDKDRERDRDRTRDRDRDAYKRRDRDRSRSRERDRDRDRSRSRERDRDKDRDRDRDRTRERDRDRGKDRTNRSKSIETNKDSKSDRSKDSSKIVSTEAASSSQT